MVVAPVFSRYNECHLIRSLSVDLQTRQTGSDVKGRQKD